MGRTDESCEDEDEDVKPLPFTVTQLRVNVNAPPFFFLTYVKRSFHRRHKRIEI